MGFKNTHFSAATAAVTNRFVTSEAMKAAAYTLANAGAMPTAGARLVTIRRDVTNAAPDTVTGGVTIVGKDLLGATVSETLAVGADTVTVTGTTYFASVTSVTGNVGWVKGGADPDNFICGCAAAAIVATGSGTIRGLFVNTAAAGTVTVADATGTLFIVPSNQAAGTFYEWSANFVGYLSITAAAATDITVMHTDSMPANYALS